MKSKDNVPSSVPEFGFLHPPVALSRFIEQMGITPITAWRYRRDGKLNTVNICGRVYVTAEEIANFNRRASAGEFAQTHKAPAPRRLKNAIPSKRERAPQNAPRRAA